MTDQPMAKVQTKSRCTIDSPDPDLGPPLIGPLNKRKARLFPEPVPENGPDRIDDPPPLKKPKPNFQTFDTSEGISKVIFQLRWICDLFQ